MVFWGVFYCDRSNNNCNFILCSDAVACFFFWSKIRQIRKIRLFCGITYSVAHATGKAGMAGAAGVFVANDAVAAYQQFLIALYGDLAFAEAT